MEGNQSGGRLKQAMFGGSSKFGRGGGRGGGGGGATKRFSVPPQPPRPSVPGGLSLSGGPRNRNPGPASAAPPAVEETFSLVSGNDPLAFAMIMRLAPELVAEIRHAEAQGETAKIKFDVNSANPNGNLISVGGKEFRFTWSKDSGVPCDIYEEKQSGEEGNGLLVESGCAWFKLYVQRILDESTTNHVKMLSEEAERKNKARKAIILDHENPSMKNQIRQLVAVEATTTWRMGYKRKQPPPKKRKVDPPHVSSGGPLRSAYKSGLPSSSKTARKVGRVISPPASPPNQFQASTSPSGAVNISKNNALMEDAGFAGQPSKEDTTEREATAKPGVMSPDRTGHKVNLDSKAMDLQSLLISLLRDNPRGMTIKALEKAIGYPIPGSGKMILSRIASYQAPGKYLLRPGVELEGFKGPSPGSGSSFEVDHNQENFDHTPVQEPTFPEEVLPNNGHVQANFAAQGELHASENVDIEQRSPDPFGDKKNSDNSDERVDSSSDSGSDSDSESRSSDSRSDSGSPSRSRSRSRSQSRSRSLSHNRSRSRSRSKSPARSRSGSSSDSDSDASSNQEGSDEDVDIMTSDDDKGLKHNIPDLGHAFPALPPDGGILDIDRVDDKLDGHESDIVDIDVVEEADCGNGASVEEMNPISASHNELQERQNFIGRLFDEEETAFEDNFKQEQSDSSMRASRGQTRREYDSRYSDMKPEQVKRLKTESYLQTAVQQGDDRHYSLSSHDLSPEKNIEDVCESPAVRMLNRADRDMNADFNIQKGSQVFSGKSSVHSQQLGRMSYDQGSSGKTCDVSGKSNRKVQSSSHGHLPMQKERSVTESQCEGYGAAAERGPRSGKEGSSGGKYPVPADSPYDKPGETMGSNLEVGQISSSQVGSSRKHVDRAGTERPTLVNGKGGAVLQRELSGLELGELRPEEDPVNKSFERKGSFKQSENKTHNSEKRSINPSRGKTPGKLKTDLGKPSPSKLPRKRTVECREDDPAVPFPQGSLSQLQYLPKGDYGDGSVHIGKMVDMSKSVRNGPQQLDSKRGIVSHSVKESKTQAVGVTTNMSNGQKEAVSVDYGGGLKRRESSSDENSCSYSKYEKNEPELKGQIKDFLQYEEYVREFCDKYDSYCSINKTLGNYRNEFLKMGKELDLAKGRDLERYNHVEAQLRDSFRLYGQKRERLSKIFAVLHAELKHLKQMITEFVHTYSKDSS